MFTLVGIRGSANGWCCERLCGNGQNCTTPDYPTINIHSNINMDMHIPIPFLLTIPIRFNLLAKVDTFEFVFKCEFEFAFKIMMNMQTESARCIVIFLKYNPF
jgi:hypothetical protein